MSQASNKERILEELKREIESDLEKVVQKARGCGLVTVRLGKC